MSNTMQRPTVEQIHLASLLKKVRDRAIGQRDKNQGNTTLSLIGLTAVASESTNDENDETERDLFELSFDKVLGDVSGQFGKVKRAEKSIKAARVALKAQTLTQEEYTTEEKKLLNSLFIRYYSSEKRKADKDNLRVSLAKLQERTAQRIIEAEEALAESEAATA